MFQASHLRNDQSLASAASSGQLEQRFESPVALNSECLPQREFSAAEVDEAKRQLMRERLGVSYRDVAADIAREPLTFGPSVDFRSASLTQRFVQLSPSLGAQYNIIASEESFLARFLAAIPVVGLPLQSSEFLHSLAELNSILPDMLKAGLIEIQRTPPRAVSTVHSIFAPPMTIGSLCTAAVSDLCRVALAAE